LLGLCVAVGHPLVFTAFALAGVVLVAGLFIRRESFINAEPEVVLEHR